MSEDLKCSMNWEAECERLQRCIEMQRDGFSKSKEQYLSEIAELKHEIMIWEQKWSVVEMFLGKEGKQG